MSASTEEKMVRSSTNPDGTVRTVPTNIEKVRYRPKEGARMRSLLLENVTEGMFLGDVHLFGHQVNRQGGRMDVDHIITRELVIDRTPMVMNLRYATLEPKIWQDEPDD